MKRILTIVLLVWTVQAHGADVANIPYTGQRVEIDIQYDFPVTIRFDDLIQQIIMDPGTTHYTFKPDISKVKTNSVVFYSTKKNPKPEGITFRVGSKPNELEDYPIDLVGSQVRTPRTINIHNKLQAGSAWAAQKKIRTRDLMKGQDGVLYNMLFAHRFGKNRENYTVKYINQTISVLGFREVASISAIKGNVYLQINSKRKEEVGIYSAKLRFCNTSKDQIDTITPQILREMFPAWEKISYEYDKIPPRQCMDIYVISKRDKGFYETYINN